MGQTEAIAHIFRACESKNYDRDLAKICISVSFRDFAKAYHTSETQTNRRCRESEVLIKRTFESAIRRNTGADRCWSSAFPLLPGSRTLNSLTLTALQFLRDSLFLRSLLSLKGTRLPL
jgi:hypothetical protein